MYYFPHTLLLIVVFISPLIFGSVYLWSSVLLESVIFTAFLLHIFSSRQTRTPIGNAAVHFYFIPMMIFLMVVMLQMLPLSTELFKVLFPERSEFWQQIYFLAGRSPEGPFFISFFPWGTLVEFSKFLAYILASYLTACLIQADQELVDRLYIANSLAWIISLTGCIASLIAILQIGFGASAIYGFWTPLHSTTFMGPYVNRNHLAGLLEMCLPMQINLLTSQFIDLRNHKSISRSSKCQHNKAYMVIHILMFLITICGLLITQSRSGILVGLFIICIQTVFITFVLNKYYNLGIIFAILLVSTLIGIIVSINLDTVIIRFQELIFKWEGNVRWSIARDGLNIFQTYPWLGTGLGSFPMVFSIFKTSTLQAIVEHAHQDYIEMLTDLGLLGGIPFFTFFVLAIIRGSRHIWWIITESRPWKSDNLHQFSLALGAVAGVLALLLHGFVDSNMRIPANALYLFILVGILLGLPPIQHETQIKAAAR